MARIPLPAARAAVRRVRRRRRRRPAAERVGCHRVARKLVRRGHGLEIGGPSGLFVRRGPLPLYPFVGALDNCNFGCETVWEGSIEEGRTFRYDDRRPPGVQHILEATEFSTLRDERYDFVLSSHTLEHTANPLRALEEWVRVLRPGGGLVLVVPHRDGTFDHRRPVTAMLHLLDDHCLETGEDDLTHLPEILELHDLALDRRAGDRAAFEARSRRNAENRCLHHHVFDTRLVVEIVDWAGLELLAVEPAARCHVFAIARKPASPGGPGNARFLDADAAWRRASPFVLDRAAGTAGPPR